MNDDIGFSPADGRAHGLAVLKVEDDWQCAETTQLPDLFGARRCAHDVVPAGYQQSYQRFAYGAGRAGDKDPHVSLLLVCAQLDETAADPVTASRKSLVLRLNRR